MIRLGLALLAAGGLLLAPVPAPAAPNPPGLTVLYSVDERGEVTPCG